MTDTPETDNQAEAAHNMCLYYDCQGQDDNIPYPIVVPVDFARRLERERDAARKEAAIWKANRDQIIPELIRRREAKDRSREIIARIASKAKEEQP